jgi:flavorubredoxin
MRPRELRPGVYSVGAVDWDRRLFDTLIPLPEGTSYNSYLVRGSEKTALLDTVDPTMTATLLDNLSSVDRIDYVVVQHAEQDHSGSLPAVLARFPEAEVLCSARAVDLLATHIHVAGDHVRAVQDGEELQLGGMTLRFVYTPWAHWPETMSTFLVEDRILFSCDLFGSHLATSDLIGDERELYPAAKRYYAEIMMPYRPILKKNLEKVEPLGAELVAPSHGPVYGRPRFIYDAYREWIDGPPYNLVLIPYVTMHGSTKVMVERLAGALIDGGVKVERLDLQGVDLGRLATALVDAATLVAATPTVITHAHPLMVSALYLAAELKPKARFLSAMVSYGWATKAMEQMTELTAALKAEVIEPVIVKGLPGAADLVAVDGLAAAIAAKHAAAGLTQT